MSEIHFRLHFWPFQIDMQLFILFLQMAAGAHFRSHLWPFHIDTQLFFDKMAAGGHFGWDDNVNYRTRLSYVDE